jgi:hypothetical protein
MWWRLLEVGERIESGDEYYSHWNGGKWFAYDEHVAGSTIRNDSPVRRRVPSSGAEISAGKDRPENLVKLGDHVGINCGTWFGCTGRVVSASWSDRRNIMLDNVFVGGNRMVITEPLGNVTVLVEPVAETLSQKNCPVCGVIS